MNPEEIGDILDEIGERVGPLGSAAWDILVQGTFAVSLVGTIAGVILLVGGLIAAVRLHAYGQTKTYEDVYNSNRRRLTDEGTFAVIAAWFVGAAGALSGILVFTHNLVGVLAPEFRVLENILQSIKGA